MDTLDTHTDRATKRLTIKLHNQLCLNPRQKAQTPSHTPRPRLSVPRYGQVSTGLSSQLIIHSTVDNGMELRTAWAHGARKSRSNGIGNRAPVRGMNADRASGREDSGLCRSTADHR